MSRFLPARFAAVVLAATVTGLVGVAVPAHAAAVTIHVSPTGSDSAPGTPAAPLKTLAAALSVF